MENSAGVDEDRRLQHGVVALQDRVDRDAGDAGDVEQDLDDERADDRVAEREADRRHDRQRRVPQHVADQHPPGGEALAARRAHVVLQQHLADARPRDARDERNRRDRQDGHRQDVILRLSPPGHRQHRPADREQIDERRGGHEARHGEPEDDADLDQIVQRRPADRRRGHPEQRPRDRRHEDRQGGEPQAHRQRVADEVADLQPGVDVRRAEVQPHHVGDVAHELDQERAVQPELVAEHRRRARVVVVTQHNLDGVARREVSDEKNQQRRTQEQRHRHPDPIGYVSRHRRPGRGAPQGPCPRLLLDARPR